jgi:2-oxoisovalerate dehydrogenase E1 component alpha subunit
MTSWGEEATMVGNAAALKPEDVMFAQYREVGSFMWRGYTLKQVADQLVANVKGHTSGR